MTDAHCHIRRNESRHFICDPCDSFDYSTEGEDIRFIGFHPWNLELFNENELLVTLDTFPHLGVGEIGLDGLKKDVPYEKQFAAFSAQLRVAAKFKRPVVLHGTKCWGKVVNACKVVAESVPAFLFHGFSRSEGLLPDIFDMNGFISVGPALLNDHAVNYRGMVKKIPLDRILVESDATKENAAEAPSVKEIAAKLAELRGEDPAVLNAAIEANADRFVESLK